MYLMTRLTEKAILLQIKSWIIGIKAQPCTQQCSQHFTWSRPRVFLITSLNPLLGQRLAVKNNYLTRTKEHVNVDDRSVLVYKLLCAVLLAEPVEFFSTHLSDQVAQLVSSSCGQFNRFQSSFPHFSAFVSTLAFV